MSKLKKFVDTFAEVRVLTQFQFVLFISFVKPLLFRGGFR